MLITLDGVEQSHGKGDVVVIEPGVKHSFTSQGGAVIEEVSSTHYADDSYYTDPAIARNANRKTYVTYWLVSPIFWTTSAS